MKEKFRKLFSIFCELNFVQFVKWILILGAWGVTAVISYILYIAHDLPDIRKLEEPRMGRKVTILDSTGQTLATYGNIYGYQIPYSGIPRNLVNAVLATEDRKFFEHPGVDVMGIIRAAFANFKAGYTVQGGSTITQQLAKIAFLSPKKTIKRKIQEALLSLELEHKYTKKQILSIYLNRVYLGAGIYGIDAAAKYYFGKNVQDLNLYESAIIAGLLKAPSKFSPLRNVELTGQRAYQVLNSMFEQGIITKEQLDTTDASVKLNTTLLGSKEYGYFTSWIYENITDYVANENIDITVKTTLNRRIQKIAQNTLNTYLNKIGKERKVSQGAIVVLSPRGKILAMIGGRDFSKSPFNRVTQAVRPTGSAFKIFVYTAAVEYGAHPDDIFEDKEVEFGTWKPRNFNRNFLGELTVADAFAKSINTVAVQVADAVGVGNIIRIAHRMGIKSHIDHNLSIALGSASTNLLELTTSYATIANDGIRADTYGIEYVKNSMTGTILYAKQMTDSPQVVKEETAETMQTLLRHCVLQGCARLISNESFDISGKTGTSQDHRDAWFISFTDKYVMGVWLGNDDYSPMNRVSGGTYPVLIARDILRAIK